MHEITIAKKILETIELCAQDQGIAHLRLAKLRIGRMLGFEKEHLESALASFGNKKELKDLKFEIEAVPVKLRCEKCQKEFVDERFNDASFAHEVSHAPALYIPPKCQECLAMEVALVSGNEMELVSIEGD
ncbi:MAG: hydrogenase maturation nickel metallochaperone HypA [Pseudomonadota bacterium]